MKKASVFLFFAFAVISGFITNHALAQTPTINSFTISPDSGISGYPYALTWTLQDAGGSSLIVPCVDGVKAKNANTGSDITCDSKIASSAASSGGSLLKLINISGFTKTIQIQLIPKTTSGVENDSQGKTVSATISTDPNPIASFTSSVSNTEIGKSIKLSWNIPDAVGANISVECKSGVKATSTSYAGDIPCGKQIFSTALPKTGSLTLSFTNSSIDAVPVAITLFPKIGATAYNGVHTGTLTINIASDRVPDPIVTFFKTSAPSTLIFSGEKFPISWSTEYAKGINLKISCADGVTATSSKNPSAQLPCGDLAFSDLLATSSNLTLVFKNNSANRQAIALSLVPSFKIKEGYDATKIKTILVEIRSSSDKPPIAMPSALPTPAATPSPALLMASPAPPTTKSSLSATASAKPKTFPSPTPTKIGEPILPRSKNIPSSLERLFHSPIDSGKIKNILENTEKKASISETLIDGKKLDTIETIFLNQLDSTYDVSGYRAGKLMFLIPIKVKINLVADESGNIKKTDKPWWSFLVRFK